MRAPSAPSQFREAMTGWPRIDFHSPCHSHAPFAVHQLRRGTSQTVLQQGLDITGLHYKRLEQKKSGQLVLPPSGPTASPSVRMPHG
jgi:hypothetical protein